MRLLFITQSLVHGGAERHAVTLANRLAERGHEVAAGADGGDVVRHVGRAAEGVAALPDA